jgi:hypothetical protein
MATGKRGWRQTEPGSGGSNGGLGGIWAQTPKRPEVRRRGGELNERVFIFEKQSNNWIQTRIQIQTLQNNAPA